MRAAPLLALLLLGCARNAILELDVELPAGVSHAELAALSAPPPFDAPAWDAASVERLDEVGDRARVELVAEGSAIEAPLGVVVRLCASDPCEDAPAEVRVRAERAFYVGARTWLDLAIPAVPASPATVEVARCEVGGCLPGDTLDFCRDDGTHYCE